MRIRQLNNTLIIQRESDDPVRLLKHLQGELHAAGLSSRLTGSGKTRFARRDYIKLTFHTTQAALAAHQVLRDNYGADL